MPEFFDFIFISLTFALYIVNCLQLIKTQKLGVRLSLGQGTTYILFGTYEFDAIDVAVGVSLIRIFKYYEFSQCFIWLTITLVSEIHGQYKWRPRHFYEFPKMYRE